MEEGECLILGISVSLVTMLEASKETGFKNMKMSPLIFNNMSNLFTVQIIRLALVRNKSLTLFQNLAKKVLHLSMRKSFIILAVVVMKKKRETSALATVNSHEVYPMVSSSLRMKLDLPIRRKKMTLILKKSLVLSTIKLSMKLRFNGYKILKGWPIKDSKRYRKANSAMSSIHSKKRPMSSLNLTVASLTTTTSSLATILFLLTSPHHEQQMHHHGYQDQLNF